eukprot:gene15406-biopygen1984
MRGSGRLGKWARGEVGRWERLGTVETMIKRWEAVEVGAASLTPVHYIHYVHYVRRGAPFRTRRGVRSPPPQTPRSPPPPGARLPLATTHTREIPRRISTAPRLPPIVQCDARVASPPFFAFHGRCPVSAASPLYHHAAAREEVSGNP